LIGGTPSPTPTFQETNVVRTGKTCEGVSLTAERINRQGFYPAKRHEFLVSGFRRYDSFSATISHNNITTGYYYINMIEIPYVKLLCNLMFWGDG
jgi:hypothetical protein